MRIIIRATEFILAVIFLVAVIVILVGGSPNEKQTVVIDDFDTIMGSTISQAPLSSANQSTSSANPIENDDSTYILNEEEVIVLAKMLYGEARGVPSDTEKAACIWCVLNRVDQGMGTIIEVVTAPHQFAGYQEDHPVEPDLKALCEDVLERWYREKNGETNVGRVLPSDYLFFTGDGEHNYFRNAYKNGEIWTWDYDSPYED